MTSELCLPSGSGCFPRPRGILLASMPPSPQPPRPQSAQQPHLPRASSCRVLSLPFLILLLLTGPASMALRVRLPVTATSCITLFLRIFSSCRLSVSLCLRPSRSQNFPLLSPVPLSPSGHMLLSVKWHHQSINGRGLSRWSPWGETSTHWTPDAATRP